MASSALNLGNFCGVRKVLDRTVTILASKNTVRPGGVLSGIDGNIFAGAGFHSLVAVASEALLVRSRDRRRPSQEQGDSQSGEHLNTFLSAAEREFTWLGNPNDDVGNFSGRKVARIGATVRLFFNRAWP